MRITNAGNVGIGTTIPRNPDSYAQVLNVDGANAVINISATSASQMLRLGQVNADGNITERGSGNLIFGTNNTERVRIDSSGNVGVGTTGPVSKLHVHGNYTNDGTGGFMLDATDNTDPEKYVLKINPFVVAAAKVGYQFQTKSVTGGTNVPLTFDNAGLVGIGTTGPMGMLDVAPSGVAVAYVRDSAGVAGTIKMASAGGSNYFESGITTTSASAAPLYFTNMNASNTWMTIGSTGNVGIGTTSPQSPLHIKATGDTADVYGGLRMSPAAADGAAVSNYNQLTGFRHSGLSLSGSANGSSYAKSYIFLNDTGISFGTSDSSTDPLANIKMTILNAGNVGIGTPSPGTQLHIAGSSAVIILQDTGHLASSNSLVSFMSFRDSAGTEYGWLGDGSGANNYVSLFGGTTHGLQLGAGGSVRATIDTSGNVGINTSPSYRLDVLGAAGTFAGRFTSNDGTSTVSLASSGYGLNIQNSTAGATVAYVVSSGSGGTGLASASSSSTGNGLVGQNTSTGYYCYLGTGSYSIICSGPTSGVSDRRLKKDIHPLEAKEGLSAIMRLEPVHYRWKDERMNKAHPGGEIGFVAQNVETVLPDLVSESPQSKDAPLKLEGGLQKGLQYDRLAAPLVKAVQELKADNDNLRAANGNEAAQIRTLTARLDALEAARR
jgi:hypothetical protein